jgi:hypothetical protein
MIGAIATHAYCIIANNIISETELWMTQFLVSQNYDFISQRDIKSWFKKKRSREEFMKLEKTIILRKPYIQTLRRDYFLFVYPNTT